MRSRRARTTSLAAAIAGLLLLAGACAHVRATAHAARPTPIPSDRDRTAIDSVLHQLAAAIQTKDIDAIQRLYVFPDSTSATAKRREYEAIAGLDSVTCSIRLGQVTIDGDKATAAALCEIDYRENGRLQTETKWMTYELRRAGATSPGAGAAAATHAAAAPAWPLTSDAERDYARAWFTNLNVRLDPDSATMSGMATLMVAIRLPGEDNLILNLNRGLEVTGVTNIAEVPIPFTRKADALIVPLPADLRRGVAGAAAASHTPDSLTLTVRFRGALFNERKEQGYSQVSIAPAGCFASWVTSWYPHLQGSAASKSPGRLSFDVPAAFTVASSGRPMERHTYENGPGAPRAFERFAVDVPLDYSFAAAPYFHRERTVDDVALGVFLLAGGEAKADLYLDGCARILDAERRIYGSYPFDGYAIVEVPAEAVGSLGGSSEQGMNLFPVGILPDNEIPLPLLGHEMGHSWWGNLIGGEDGPVLDEGLAQMTAVLAIRDLDGEAAMRRFLKYGRPDYGQSARMYFGAFAGIPGRDLPMAVSRQGGSDSAILHDLADVKGHFVYNMLRESIGDSAFVGGLRAIIAQHTRETVTLRDLETEWEKASGRNLDRFFEQWFYRTGAPEFTFADSVFAETGSSMSPDGSTTPQGDGKPDGADVLREDRYTVLCRIDQLREPYDVDAEVVAVLDKGPVVRKVAVSGKETSFAFRVPTRPRAVLFDPDYKILRWTEEFTGDSLMQKTESLRSIGMHAKAIAALEGYLARHPESAGTTVQLGLCLEETGKLAAAEARFRSVCDRYALYPAYNPSVPAAMLHMGRVCDLTGRRDEAVSWYRKAVEMPDENGSRAEAEAPIRSPWRAQSRPAYPTVADLRLYAGTYADPFLGVVEVTFDEDAGLIVTLKREGLGSHLAWVEGSLFRLAARPGITFEFVGGGSGPTGHSGGAPGGGSAPSGNVKEAVVKVSGREFRLERQPDQGH